MLLDSTNCSHGDIKLTEGKSSNEGDVQVCVNGTWGYICDWYWYYWYNVYSNVNVVCRQLGYTASQLQCKILILLLIFSIHNIGNSYSYGSFFGGSQDIAPIVRDRIVCNGNEGTLIECTTYYNYFHSCTSVAGVYCAGIDFSLF